MDDESEGDLPVNASLPRKVRGLLDYVVADSAGEPWTLDDSDPLAFLGLGVGASPDARLYALLGWIVERQAELEKSLAAMKPQPSPGRPRSQFPNIDEERAAAVLGADNLWRDKTGTGAPSQRAAIETAREIDKILVGAGVREKSLFPDTTTPPRLETSVSKGLRDLDQVDRFSKK